MPYPLVPPDPDQPKPALLENGGGLVAFSLTLTGMEPSTEQQHHRFHFAGQEAAVWVPVTVDATRHVFSGVGIGDLSGVTETFQLKSTFDDGTHQQGKAHTLQARRGALDAEVRTVLHTRRGEKIRLAVAFEVGCGSGWHLVAAPYASRTPKFADHAAYARAGAWRSVDHLGGTTELTVVPNGVDRYACFLAKGITDGVIVPLSAPMLHTL